MISLKPAPAVTFRCPHCDILMQADGWAMPGSWMLGTYTCSQCQRRYYGTLPSAYGLMMPTLLDMETGTVSDNDVLNIFSTALARQYASRSPKPVTVRIETFHPLTRPIIVNCLSHIYGGALIRLLNAQHYLDQGLDVWVIVPRSLRWMVLDGVAEIWTVDLPLSQGDRWHDDLHAQIERRVAELNTCFLATLFLTIHERHYDIERFTRVRPFPVADWQTKTDAPVITFAWRGDRLWRSLDDRKLPVRPSLRRRLQSVLHRLSWGIEARQINALAAHIRREYPQADFAVTGLGTHDYFSADIHDLRRRPSDMNDAVEREWCERYARSHIVIGVEGSNMLLPSALAATVIELLPPDRYGHLGILSSQPASYRETLFRNRLLPFEVSPRTVAVYIFAILNRFPESMLRYTPPWNDYEFVEGNFEAMWERFDAARPGTRQDLR